MVSDRNPGRVSCCLSERLPKALCQQKESEKALLLLPGFLTAPLHPSHRGLLAGFGQRDVAEALPAEAVVGHATFLCGKVLLRLRS